MRQVEYVLAVVDHGSFTKAAAAMRVSQPSLSDGIRRLETELDVRLFHRLGRSVELTDAGARVRRARPPAQPGPRRGARVGRRGARACRRAPSTSSRCRPSPPIRSAGSSAASARRIPGVVVRIAAPEDVGAVDAMVLDGRCELGLTELPPRRDELVAIALERQEIVAVCPPRTRLPAPGRLPVAQLAGHAARHDAARALDPRSARPGAGGGRGRAGDRGRDVAARGDRAARARRRGHLVPARRARRVARARRARSWPASSPRSRARSASCTGRRPSPRPPRAFVELARPSPSAIDARAPAGNHVGSGGVTVATPKIERERAYVDVLASRQDPDPDGRRGAARPARPPLRRARASLRARHAARAAVPRGIRAGRLRDGLLLGRGAQVLADRGRVHDRGRLRRWVHAEPDVRRGVQRPHRAHRGRARGVRSRPRRATTTCCGCSGRTTTRRRACARATTSARSTGRRIYTFGREQLDAARDLARDVPGAPRGGGLRRRSPPRSSRRRRSTTPRTTTSSTWRRTRAATAGSAAPACPARLAWLLVDGCSLFDGDGDDDFGALGW